MQTFLVAKTVHLFFMFGWFAGLFYLPRIFVNLADKEVSAPEGERLIGMAHRLLRFTIILGMVAVLAGLVTWNMSSYAMVGWLHLKLVAVVLLFLFQIMCTRYLQAFREGRVLHSSRWFRWFNEIPSLILLVALVAVLWKPF